jgi:hypothetical protein
VWFAKTLANLASIAYTSVLAYLLAMLRYVRLWIGMLFASFARSVVARGREARRITTFQFNDCVDEFSIRPFRAGLTAALEGKQHAVLSFRQHMVEMQQRGRLQDDGGTQNACRVHEKGAQTGDDTLCSAQVGSTVEAAIEDL